MRTLADSRDRLAFGAFMRGPMVGLTDEELLDIAEEVHRAGPEASPTGLFGITTPPVLVSHRVARSVLETLQKLRARANITTPRVLLAEAIEQLQLRVALSAPAAATIAPRARLPILTGLLSSHTRLMSGGFGPSFAIFNSTGTAVPRARKDGSTRRKTRSRS